MAFGRLDRPAAPRPMGEINMTPLIDVMLVLLVIFMVTAPLVASSLKLDLPRAEGGTEPGDAPTLTLSLDAAGTLTLGRQVIVRDDLDAALAAAARRDPRTELHLRIDRAVPYGEAVGLIDAAQKAGLTRIGFATDAPDDAAGTRSPSSPAGTR